ncbi:MAG: SPOR domain-containing protein, partial [Proteobacteria bacterium]|nr:SPOR domain-containing protein [Pseudomonadota bacterium]
QEWLRLKKIFDKQLAEFDLTVERVELEAKGTFYRVLVNLVQSPYSAQKLCTELRQTDQYCAVLKPIDIHFESS